MGGLLYDQGNRQPASSAEVLHRAQTETHRQVGAWRQLKEKNRGSIAVKVSF